MLAGPTQSSRERAGLVVPVETAEYLQNHPLHMECFVDLADMSTRSASLYNSHKVGLARRTIKSLISVKT